MRPVHSGTATLKDATSEAIRDWVTNVEGTHYILGSAAGPHPYPMMVRDFQAVIGREARRQCAAAFGAKPDVLLACVGGGSNAIGLFHEVRALRARSAQQLVFLFAVRGHRACNSAPFQGIAGMFLNTCSDSPQTF